MGWSIYKPRAWACMYVYVRACVRGVQGRGGGCTDEHAPSARTPFFPSFLFLFQVPLTLSRSGAVTCLEYNVSRLC